MFITTFRYRIRPEMMPLYANLKQRFAEREQQWGAAPTQYLQNRADAYQWMEIHSYPSEEAYLASQNLIRQDPEAAVLWREFQAIMDPNYPALVEEFATVGHNAAGSAKTDAGGGEPRAPKIVLSQAPPADPASQKNGEHATPIITPPRGHAASVSDEATAEVPAMADVSATDDAAVETLDDDFAAATPDDPEPVPADDRPAAEHVVASPLIESASADASESDELTDDAPLHLADTDGESDDVASDDISNDADDQFASFVLEPAAPDEARSDEAEDELDRTAHDAAEIDAAEIDALEIDAIEVDEIEVDELEDADLDVDERDADEPRSAEPVQQYPALGFGDSTMVPLGEGVFEITSTPRPAEDVVNEPEHVDETQDDEAQDDAAQDDERPAVKFDVDDEFDIDDFAEQVDDDIDIEADEAETASHDFEISDDELEELDEIPAEDSASSSEPAAARSFGVVTPPDDEFESLLDEYIDEDAAESTDIDDDKATAVRDDSATSDDATSEDDEAEQDGRQLDDPLDESLSSEWIRRDL